MAERASDGSDYQPRFRLANAALGSGMLGEALVILQEWFEVVPRSNRNGMDRASVRLLIDTTVEYLENPRAPHDSSFAELWAKLRELWAQAQDYTTADNDVALRRLMQRLES